MRNWFAVWVGLYFMVESRRSEFDVKKLLLATLLSVVTVSAANATMIDINTKQWTYEVSPFAGKISSNTPWLSLGSNTPKKSSNSSGGLISDFSLFGDFSFEGKFSPTMVNNTSCADSNDNSCNDNDIIGLVFGWQDADNHYRLGWSQGDERYTDVNGTQGLFLVEERAGVSTVLQNWGGLFWEDDNEYTFSISRVGSVINFALSGLMRNTPGTQGAETSIATESSYSANDSITFNITNNTFVSGKIGVYTESQTGIFSSLVARGTVDVVAPATFGLFAIGGVLLWFRKKVSVQPL